MMFYAKRQRGAALIISAVLLVAMTLISVTAMRSSVTNIKVSTNQRMKQGAYQAAESALMLLLDDDPYSVRPATTNIGDSKANNDYYSDRLSSQSSPTHTEADVIVRFEEIRNNVLISGHQINSTVLMYQADAYGRVVEASGESMGAGAVNRMGIGLVRPN